MENRTAPRDTVSASIAKPFGHDGASTRYAWRRASIATAATVADTAVRIGISGGPANVANTMSAWNASSGADDVRRIRLTMTNGTVRIASFRYWRGLL